MQITVLGAHQVETPGTQSVTLLVNGELAMDAGALCSNITLAQQRGLRGVLVTHQHMDHVKDLPALALNAMDYPPVDVYLMPETHQALRRHIFNGVMWFNIPDEEQGRGIRFRPVEIGADIEAGGYAVRALPVFHSVPAVGFEVTGRDGKRLFYTGDTGPGCESVWQCIRPDLLISECTLPARLSDQAAMVKHLSTSQLRGELLAFERVQGYIPRVMAIHLNPEHVDEIAAELAAIARELGAEIIVAHEGLTVDV